MSMSPESNLVVKYLKASGPSTLDELHAQLPQEARPKFLKRISNLKAMGWLAIETDSDGQRRYRLARLPCARRCCWRRQNACKQRPRLRSPCPSCHRAALTS